MLTTTDHPRRLPLRLGAVIVCLALSVVACGSDDESEVGAESTAGSSSSVAPTSSVAATAPPTSESVEATTSTPAPVTDLEACEPFFAISQALGPVGDPSSVPELLDQIEQVKPAEIDAELTLMIASARTVLDSGGTDFSPFETEEFRDASGTADRWMYDNCEFETRSEVDAEDYSFIGVEGTYAPGPTAFWVTNTGQEVHELIVLRRQEGVTDAWDDILALPEEEAQSMVEVMGSAFVDQPGATGLATVDLVPGEYIAICFIPLGTIAGEDGFVEGEGPPHFLEGMRAEFTVA